MSYTYAIGDLHGRVDLLEETFVQVAKHSGGHACKLVVCGDFIDRGPDSAEIIRALKGCQNLENPIVEVMVLKGNHEAMMIECLSGKAQLSWWLGNGGAQTLESYGYKDGDTLSPLKIPIEELEWVNDLPVYHFDEHRAFVHAGFDSSKPIELQNPQHMMWMRAPREQDYSFEGRHVVHGHEQYADGPIQNPNKTNIDTFAWATGRLAIAVFEDSKAGGPIDILWATGDPHQRYLDWSKEDGID